jgi:hypothetical protein
MRLGEGNHPFDTSFHRHALHRTDRILDGVEGCDEFSKIVCWHLIFLLRPESDKHADQNMASLLKDIPSKPPV